MGSSILNCIKDKIGSSSSSANQDNDNFDKKVSELTDEEKAIFGCKKCKDNIKAYIKKLEYSANKQRTLAKEHLKSKNRDRAKMCLNQSKFLLKQVESSSGQLAMIEEQIFIIETTRSQKETLEVLDQGNKILKEMQKEVNIEKWEKISDDMNDIKSSQDELGEFLKKHNVNMVDYEKDLNKDLEIIMGQMGIVDKEINVKEGRESLVKQSNVSEGKDSKEIKYINEIPDASTNCLNGKKEIKEDKILLNS